MVAPITVAGKSAVAGLTRARVAENTSSDVDASGALRIESVLSRQSGPPAGPGRWHDAVRSAVPTSPDIYWTSIGTLTGQWSIQNSTQDAGRTLVTHEPGGSTPPVVLSWDAADGLSGPALGRGNSNFNAFVLEAPVLGPSSTFIPLPPAGVAGLATLAVIAGGGWVRRVRNRSRAST